MFNNPSLLRFLVANAALIALMAAQKGIHPNEYKAWAMTQINYILGDNKMNMSYEIGYGNKYPLQPHHRGRLLIFFSILDHMYT